VYVDGVRHAKSTGTANRRLAERIDQNVRDELNLKRHAIRPPAPEMPFAELAALFIAEGSPKPWIIDRLKVLLPYFGETLIGRFHKGLAREYRRFRHSTKQITETTVNRDLQALRHIFFWGVDEGYLVANPLKNVPLITQRRKPLPVMTLEEEAKLLQAASPHLREIVIAALDTGMRRGEILNQRWEHVDFNRGLLSVTRSKTAGGEAREIPFTHRLFDLLALRPQPEGLVFTFKGHPVRAIKTAWKATIRRAGIRYIRFHDLRHTFNTRLMEAGVMQEVRKALMGHSSGNDVHSIYTHVELPAKRDAIRKLEAWIHQQHLSILQGGETHDDSTKVGSGFGQIRNLRSGSTQTVEEEIPGGSGSRPN
jgi:integrase